MENIKRIVTKNNNLYKIVDEMRLLLETEKKDEDVRK